MYERNPPGQLEYHGSGCVEADDRRLFHFDTVQIDLMIQGQLIWNDASTQYHITGGPSCFESYPTIENVAFSFIFSNLVMGQMISRIE
jgi:hypothetical protein